jgi:uncharacterized protein YerC
MKCLVESQSNMELIRNRCTSEGLSGLSGNTMSKKSWLNIDRNELKRLHSQGYRDVELTTHFGISGSSVCNIRKSLNLKANRCRVKIDKNEYIRLFNDGVTYPQMAQQLGISECLVNTIRKRLNLSNRKRGAKRSGDGGN